jgi:ethanolamine ammonia-lyase small subunit
MNDEKQRITDCLADISQTDLRRQYLVPNPKNGGVFLEMKKLTPARLGSWHAGPRHLTSTVLRFRADHSAAQDSVFSYVSEEFLQSCNLFTVDSMCRDKDEYVTRPDLGRKISPDGIGLIKERCEKNPDVQIIVADGLSAAAIEANVRDVMPAIIQGLVDDGITVGTPFFIRHSRVATMDAVSELVGAKVTCILIGERPGLVTSRSMSAYIAYKATVGMLETRRTVVSNIHRGGTMPVEAGAYIADLIKLMLERKASGTELK